MRKTEIERKLILRIRVEEIDSEKRLEREREQIES